MRRMPLASTTTVARPKSQVRNNKARVNKHKLVLAGLFLVVIVYAAVTITTFSSLLHSNRHQGSSSSSSRSVLVAAPPHFLPHNSAARGGARLVPGSSSSSTRSTSVGSDRSHALADTNDPIYKLQHTFPIHIDHDSSSDKEVIPHPGLMITGERFHDRTKGLDTTLEVPKFFDDSHGHFYDDSTGGSLRSYLGSGTRIMTADQAASVGSYNNQGHETIFCSIASYRDPECTATLEDLYATAAHPERIRVAILDQRAKNSTDNVCIEPSKPCTEDPLQALCKYRHLMDYMEMDAALSVGPVFARHLAQRFYRGEYFTMQLDSHVRMTADWDDDIIKQWKSARNEYAVLSTYVSDLNGRIDPITHKATSDARPIMCNAEYEGVGSKRHLRFAQQPEGPAGIHGQPTLHPFWAAGFSFARGHFLVQVPYDQYLPMIFQGEEISMTVRGYSHGYDYYAPERGVCYHMYAVKENKARRMHVPLFWEHQQLYKGAGVQAMKRLNSIVGLQVYPEDEWIQDDKEKYGLGSVRNTSKFFQTFGIHTANHTMERHLCRFVGKPMMKEFLPALRDNRMGLDWDKIHFVFVDPNPGAEEAFGKKRHHAG